MNVSLTIYWKIFTNVYYSLFRTPAHTTQNPHESHCTTAATVLCFVPVSIKPIIKKLIGLTCV